MARNHLIMEKPLVDSYLGYPGINDSRALHVFVCYGYPRDATIKQDKVSMRRARNQLA